MIVLTFLMNFSTIENLSIEYSKNRLLTIQKVIIMVTDRDNTKLIMIKLIVTYIFKEDYTIIILKL